MDNARRCQQGMFAAVPLQGGREEGTEGGREGGREGRGGEGTAHTFHKPEPL